MILEMDGWMSQPDNVVSGNEEKGSIGIMPKFSQNEQEGKKEYRKRRKKNQLIY